MYANHFLLIVSCLNMLEMDENSLPVQTKSISHMHVFNQSILMEEAGLNYGFSFLVSMNSNILGFT